MPQLFHLQPDGVCEVVALPLLAHRLAVGSGAGALSIVPTSQAGGQTAWALIVGVPQGAARVNAMRLPHGIRMLRHRDEIRLGNERFFFSTESLARIEPFPGLDARGGVVSARCPRCTDPIHAGAPAVRCPSCDIWHHEMPEIGRACWSYWTCAVCGGPNDITDEFRWDPTHL